MSYQGVFNISNKSRTGEFYTYHPIVNLVYFSLVIGITMFSLHIIMLGITLLNAGIYSYLLSGRESIKSNLQLATIVILLITTINMFFTHNGETVLFYVNGNRITLEAIFFGIISACMILAVIIWFTNFNRIISNDKLIYIFGSILPVLGLLISMVLRFIPLLKHRYDEISMGQKCMGNGYSKNIIKNIRLIVKKISILIAWSLENSIELADSMAARGYGLKGRTSFSIFKWTMRDTILLLYFTVLGIIVITGNIIGYTKMYFYPKLIIPVIDVKSIVIYIAFILLATGPIILDFLGEYKWRKLDLKI